MTSHISSALWTYNLGPSKGRGSDGQERDSGGLGGWERSSDNRYHHSTKKSQDRGIVLDTATHTHRQGNIFHTRLVEQVLKKNILLQKTLDYSSLPPAFANLLVALDHVLFIARCLLPGRVELWDLGLHRSGGTQGSAESSVTQGSFYFILTIYVELKK
jgi:hypothetical protein